MWSQLVRRIHNYIQERLRDLKIHLYPLQIQLGGIRYVRVARIANEGFNIKPFKDVNIFLHTGGFIQKKINTLDDYYESVAEEQVVEADPQNVLIEGCHCFIYKFNANQAKKGGNLPFRVHHKVNIAYLPENEWIWVSNCTPTFTRYVGEITHVVEDPLTSKPYTFTKRYSNKLDWVKMRAYLAIQRTDEHLKTSNTVQEAISEFYITKNQMDQVVFLNKMQLLTYYYLKGKENSLKYFSERLRRYLGEM
ncbi:hypothetical protein [Paenibacillus polymyxa]|uniref:Uncharacterized protein n=1 Tax=Paenibacillus polymyxa (strain SC2) TaxID=886882 RepID=E3EKZ0_PAEPS|nr:hypothetical protein [Paenibacillus polymyxa]ADO59895.1 hypothetical protein PPSC2_28685 [Paenibacillus polymyxa SC2]WPQ59880.1 hypothetical protein SKN87_26700 [Paenibacillus polymyxa]